MTLDLRHNFLVLIRMSLTHHGLFHDASITAVDYALKKPENIGPSAFFLICPGLAKWLYSSVQVARSRYLVPR